MYVVSAQKTAKDDDAHVRHPSRHQRFSCARMSYGFTDMHKTDAPALGAGSNCRKVYLSVSSTSRMAAWLPQR